MIKKTLKEWCIENNKIYLLDEWDYEKNGDLTPDTVTYGSNKKVWWKCDKGHEWQAIINSRTIRNNNCPFCGNQKLLKGFNDLETWCKENHKEYLLKEFDYEKNSFIMIVYVYLEKIIIQSKI